LTDTFTDGGCHVNVSRKSTSSAFSFSRENVIWKFPLVVVQWDASTDTTAVHWRSIVGGRISENWTFVTAKDGLQTSGPACAALMNPMLLANRLSTNDRSMSLLPDLLLPPKGLRSLGERLHSRQTDVVKEMLLVGQFAEGPTLAATLGPYLDDAPGRERSP
jgi:hypothetical protein